MQLCDAKGSLGSTIEDQKDTHLFTLVQLDKNLAVLSLETDLVSQGAQ